MPTNKSLEKSIENILRKAVEDEGGVCLKWTCPGHSVLELLVRQRLVELGFPCYEISTVKQVQQLVFQLSTESFALTTSYADDDHDGWADDEGGPYEIDD